MGEAVLLVPALGLPLEERVRLLTEYYAGLGSRGPSGLAKVKAGSALALLMGDAEPVLGALRGGKSVAEVARILGVGRPTLYEWMLEHCPVEWGKISSGRSLERLDESDELLDRATDKVEVSRAAVMQRGAQWHLERLAPKLYGVKGGPGGPTIVVNVDRSCGGQVDVGGGSVEDGGVIEYGAPEVE